MKGLSKGQRKIILKMKGGAIITTSMFGPLLFPSQKNIEITECMFKSLLRKGIIEQNANSQNLYTLTKQFKVA